jgi:3-deoxy-D-manno-octulosonic-acid transferase
MTSDVVRPFVPFLLRWRRRRGIADARLTSERMGVAGLPRPEGRLVWIHAAGTGDGQSMLTLVDRLVARGFQVLLSTRVPAAADTLKRMLPAGSVHQFMPLDLPVYVRRFLDHWRPDMVFLAGAEIWPNVIMEAERRALPVIFVNATMSDPTYARCRRLRRTVATLMARIDLCLARTDSDAERFVDLGATSVQTVGDLALDQPLPSADPMAVSAFASRVGARPIWIAAMTEPDETAFILEVHRRLLKRYPALITVVVPRLPRDGEAVATAASQLNLEVALRSRNNLPARLPGVFVADIGGEIGLFYRAGDIVFIGRSLTRGGRSPIEAAKLGCAILHGPRTEGFTDIYDALDKAQGGVMVPDAAALARVLAALFDDSAKLRLMRRNAAQTMDRLCGGTSRVMRAIEPHVLQMLVEGDNQTVGAWDETGFEVPQNH